MKDPHPAAPGPHTFTYHRHRLYYEVFGEGDKVFVYLHGLLLDAELNRGIATALAADGHKVVLFDLLGHGKSDKPTHASEYRMDLFARQLFALLDHLGVTRAAIGGISLGANVSLEAAVAKPERVQGMVLEMPVLEWAAPAAALTFAPLVVLLRYGRAVVQLISLAARRVPRTGIGPLNSILNAASHGPAVTAAVLHGVLLGPVAPTADERRAIQAPTLVLAHRFDAIHPLDDADNLVKQLPHARLVVASPVRLRLQPERYAGELSDFLADVWKQDGGLASASAR